LDAVPSLDNLPLHRRRNYRLPGPRQDLPPRLDRGRDAFVKVSEDLHFPVSRPATPTFRLCQIEVIHLIRSLVLPDVEIVDAERLLPQDRRRRRVADESTASAHPLLLPEVPAVGAGKSLPFRFDRIA